MALRIDSFEVDVTVRRRRPIKRGQSPDRAGGGMPLGPIAAASSVPSSGNGDSRPSGSGVTSVKTPVPDKVLARAEPPTPLTPAVPAPVPEVTDSTLRFISPPIEAPAPNPLPTAVAPVSVGAANAGGFKPLFKRLASVARLTPPEQPPRRGRHARAERDAGDAERLARAGGTGWALDEATRKKMEGFFGTDLADVRVHADERAARLAEDVGAEAFTLGRDVYFGGGKFDTSSRAGRGLLAHELTHVLQQTQREVPQLQPSVPGRSPERLETEADAVGDAFAAGRSGVGAAGLLIERYVSTYATNRPVTESEQIRLEKLAGEALKICTEILRAKHPEFLRDDRTLDRVMVDVDISLARGGGVEAAREWGRRLAEGIVLAASATAEGTSGLAPSVTGTPMMSPDGGESGTSKPLVGPGVRFIVKHSWKANPEFRDLSWAKLKQTEITIEGYVDVGEKGFTEVRLGAQFGELKNIGVKLDNKLWETKAKETFGEPKLKVKGGSEVTTEKADLSAAIEINWGPLVGEGKLIFGGLKWDAKTLEENNGLPKATVMALKISAGGQLNTEWNLGNNAVAKPNLKLTAGAEFEPNWGKVWQLIKDRIGGEALKQVGRNIVALSAGELILTGAFVLGGVAVIAASLKTFAEIEEMWKVASEAELACQEYKAGYLHGFGIGKGGTTSYAERGREQAQAAIAAAVTRIRANPVFAGFDFTDEELVEALKTRASELASELGKQVERDAFVPLKEEFVTAWRNAVNSHWYNWGVAERNEKYLRTRMGLKDVPVPSGKGAAEGSVSRSPADSSSASVDDVGGRDANRVGPNADAAITRAAQSSGSPLPADIRDRFESSLGADLGDVRLHTGAESAEAAAAAGAEAYTVGQDIHFGEGRYAPRGPSGLHLLAHEVAHTVQQQSDIPPTQKLDVSSLGDAAEVEATRAADAMIRGVPVAVGGTGSVASAVLQRQPDKDKDAPPPSPAGRWVAPFELGVQTDTAAATVALVDVRAKLAPWRDVGYADEMKLAMDAISRNLDALSGPSRALTPDEANTLTGVGLVAFQTYQNALKHFQQLVTAALDKYTGVSAQEGVDAVAERLHQAFMESASDSTIADAKAALAKAGDLVGEVKDYVEYATKAKAVVKAAAKLEQVTEGLEKFKSRLSQAQKVAELAESVMTLAGKVGQTPGEMQGDIGKIKAGFTLVDFAISKSGVPVIGQVWDGYIKPCAELAFNKLARLDQMIDKQVRLGVDRLDEWWNAASKGMRAPSIADSGLPGLLVQKYFVGGQPMLDFMWSLFRGHEPESVPAGVEDVFVKFRSQFNAGQLEEDRMETSTKWYDPRTWVGRTRSPNLLQWVKKNKDTVWAMLYGRLPHP